MNHAAPRKTPAGTGVFGNLLDRDPLFIVLIQPGEEYLLDPVILNSGLLFGGVRVIHHQQQHMGQCVPHSEFITTGLLTKRLVCRQK